MLRFTFEVSGDAIVDRALSRYGEYLEDARPAFEEITRDYYAIVHSLFESNGSSGPRPWSTLSDNYAAWKAARYPGRGTLVLQGTLFESLLGLGRGHIKRVSKNALTLGTSIEYAIYHQKGTRRMPSRAPVQLSEVDKRRWLKILHNHAYDAAKKARLSA